MDLSKAFDSINQEILLDKLYYYGVKNTELYWFKSYLSKRKQCVRYDNTYSTYHNVKCGVPQGSILGPLLFILYMNDIFYVSSTAKLVLYADDTNIFFTSRDLIADCNIINTELIKINQWFEINQLSLNCKKTNYMLFTNERQNYNINLKTGQNVLNQVNSTKFLGVFIDSKLSWNIHIQSLNNKVTKSLAVLYKVRKLLSPHWKLKLYKTFVLPLINYCNIVWGSACITTVKPLLITQKRH